MRTHKMSTQICTSYTTFLFTEQNRNSEYGTQFVTEIVCVCVCD